MINRPKILVTLSLSVAMISGCGAEPAEAPREQIIVAERGDAALSPASSAADETGPKAD